MKNRDKVMVFWVLLLTIIAWVLFGVGNGQANTSLLDQAQKDVDQYGAPIYYAVVMHKSLTDGPNYIFDGIVFLYADKKQRSTLYANKPVRNISIPRHVMDKYQIVLSTYYDGEKCPTYYIIRYEVSRDENGKILSVAY